MKLLDKFKQLFTGDKPVDLATVTPAPLPLKIGPRLLRFGPGFRFPAIRRVYKKRKPPVRFIDHQAITMSFRQARMHDIWTSMREAVEIRRSHRERQLEGRYTPAPNVKLLPPGTGYVVALLMLVLIGCTPDPDTAMRKVSPQNAARFEVQRVGVVEDDLAYRDRRGVYILIDRQTGKEYVGLSGVGITELGDHQVGKVRARDER